jgi:hypothetical protein
MKRIVKSMAVLLLMLSLLGTGAAMAANTTERAVSVNQKITGSLSERNEKDTFTFQLSNPGSLTISFTYPVEGEYSIKLYQQNIYKTGVNFSYSGSTSTGKVTQSMDKLRLPAGQYSIVIARAEYGDYSSGTYSFQLNYTRERAGTYEMEPNDESRQSSTLNLNQKLVGNLGGRNDQDYYKFVLKQPGLIQIQLQYDYTGEYTSTLYEINSSGSLSVVQSARFFYSGSTITGSVTQKADRLRLPAGEYYLRLQRTEYGDYSNKDYGVLVLYTAEPGASKEKEWNHEAKNSQLIDTNQTITGNLNKSGDVDYYKVALPTAATLKAQLTMRAGSSYQIVLYQVSESGSLQSLKSKSSSSSVGATISTDAVSVPAGSYYVKVQKGGGSYCNEDYQLCVASSYTTGNYPSSWAEEEVDDAIEEGLVPDHMQAQYKGKITRGEFCTLAVTFVTTCEGKTVSKVLADKGLSITNGRFTDTNDYNILVAASLGIVNGYTDGTFRPSAYITRQEAAAMLQRTAYAVGVKKANDSPVSFADSNAIGSWARNAVQFISAMVDRETGARVMGGIGNNCFGPNASYTKEQSYLTMVRLLHAVG